MSTLYFLKKEVRTEDMGILFWNSVVPSFEGIVRRAATFHVIIFRLFDGFSVDCWRGGCFLRRGGDIGTLVDMTGGRRRVGTKFESSRKYAI